MNEPGRETEQINKIIDEYKEQLMTRPSRDKIEPHVYKQDTQDMIIESLDHNNGEIEIEVVKEETLDGNDFERMQVKVRSSRRKFFDPNSHV